MVTMIITGVVMVIIFGTIYFFLYGRLIRKLKRNYKELKKLEV
jgi:preprotein translocase subunit YajC